MSHGISHGLIPIDWKVYVCTATQITNCGTQCEFRWRACCLVQVAWTSIRLPITIPTQRSMSIGLLALFGCTCALAGASVAVLAHADVVTLMMGFVVALTSFVSGWTSRGWVNRGSTGPTNTTDLWTNNLNAKFVTLHLQECCHGTTLRSQLIISSELYSLVDKHVCKHCLKEM